jgi:hypothetical protein
VAGVQAAPAPAPTPPDEVVVGAVHVDDRAHRYGVGGVEVRVSWRHQDGAVLLVRPTFEGRPVRPAAGAPASSLWLTSERGALTAFALADSTAPEDHVAFFPYHAMRLEPGPRRVRFEIVARARQSDTGEWSPIPVRGGATTDVVVEVPRYRTVSITVEGVEVEPDAYDPAVFRPHKARPDLTWSLGVGTARLGDMARYEVYTSPTHDDRYATTWRSTSTPVRLHEGDLVTLLVYDRDVVDHDGLGSFTLDIDELERLRAEPGTLRSGRVRALEVSRVTIR